MFGNLGVDQFLAVRLELAQRAFLVDAHQPAVAGNVARKNRGQSAVDAVFRHVVPEKSEELTHGHLEC